MMPSDIYLFHSHCGFTNEKNIWYSVVVWWPERYCKRLGRKQIKSHIHIFSQNDMKFSPVHNDDSQSFFKSKLNFDNKFYLQNLINWK